MPRRLFICIFPPETALAQIGEVQQKLREVITRQGVRFVRQDKIHLTLRFIGDRNEEDIAELVDALSKVESGAISLRTTVIGGFPNLSRPKVVWLGLEGKGGMELAAKVADTKNEGSDFVPHLTLARVSPGSKEIGRKLTALPPKFASPVATWTSTEFCLVETLPSNTYEIIARFPLRAP